jgi:hypothetical protein
LCWALVRLEPDTFKVFNEVYAGLGDLHFPKARPPKWKLIIDANSA